MNDTPQKDDYSFLTFFSFIWSAGVMGYVGCITFLTVPKENQRYADTILGVLLGTIIPMVLKYWFDTSRQSAKKDAIIAGSSPPGEGEVKAVPPAPAPIGDGGK